MPKVSLISCSAYEDEQVFLAIKKAVNLLGGITKFVSPGQKVLLKPNLLLGKRPEKGVTTHPSILKAVARLVDEVGGKVLIGDSPALGTTLKVSNICGFTDLSANNKYKLVNFDKTKSYQVSEGMIVKRLELTDILDKVDVIINLPKFKTHGLTSLTGAVKNLYGLIPGTTKSTFHFKMPEVGNFVNLLLDILITAKPSLNIMDAVVGMQGNGPQNGDLVDIGLIIASSEALAVDVVMAAIADEVPESIPHIMEAEKRGMLPYSLKQIEISGEKLKDHIQNNFVVPRANYHVSKSKLPAPVYNFLKDKLTAKPVIISKNCSSCKNCVEICPAQAITHREEDRMEIDYSKCIRCYCCQEICRQDAVRLKKSLLRFVYDIK